MALPQILYHYLPSIPFVVEQNISSRPSYSSLLRFTLAKLMIPSIECLFIDFISSSQIALQYCTNTPLMCLFYFLVPNTFSHIMWHTSSHVIQEVGILERAKIGHYMSLEGFDKERWRKKSTAVQSNSQTFPLHFLKVDTPFSSMLPCQSNLPPILASGGIYFPVAWQRRLRRINIRLISNETALLLNK